MIETAIWGLSVSVVVLLIFRLIDVLLRGLPQRVQEGEVSAAALLVAAKLAAALVVAAAFAAMNVVGGYVVTDRMLSMFRARPERKKEDAS